MESKHDSNHVIKSVRKSESLEPLTWFESIFAYVSLGLLCGCVQLCLILFPTLVVLTIIGSKFAILMVIVYVILTIYPIRHGKPWKSFIRSWIFEIWRKYFAYTFVSYAKLEKGQKYIFFEFPHAIFPMGQFLSASIAHEVFPDDVFCGIGADIVFYFPIYRHIMAWVGTFPASRTCITKILNSGCPCTVLPGGIAEMYLVSDKEEAVYLKKRRNTVKAALQEGAHIVPAFFYGNTKLFSPVGTDQGTDSFLSRISRKLRASIVFYTGRNYLPVPFRHPLKMAVGTPILVEGGPKSNPSDEEIDALMERVVLALQDLYEHNKPSWETRPLVVH